MKNEYFLSGLAGAVMTIVLLLIVACLFRLHDYSPIYIIGSNKTYMSIDSLCIQKQCTDSLELKTTKIELLKEMEDKGILLTPNEYTAQISSFYNTIITLLIFLFALFSFLGYYSIRILSKKDVQKTIEDLMDDSVSFRERTTQSITTVFSDNFATKEELRQLRIETLLSFKDIRENIISAHEYEEDAPDEVIDQN